jgi:type VI secretion system protein ImpB
MPNPNTAQHWLDRNRRPRVQITYDVQDDGATVQQELPFIVGVLANFQGAPSLGPTAKTLRDRKFISIDQDSFDDVFRKIAPTLTLNFSNADASTKELGEVKLQFSVMKDFQPFNVANQVTFIKGLLDQRKQLVELLAKLSLNPELSTQVGTQVGAILADTAAMKALETPQAAIPTPPAPEPPKPEPAPAPAPAENK